MVGFAAPSSCVDRKGADRETPRGQTQTQPADARVASADKDSSSLPIAAHAQTAWASETFRFVSSEPFKPSPRCNSFF